MKQCIVFAMLLFGLTANGAAADLYQVDINSHKDAATLRNSGVEPLLSVPGGYLVLADLQTGLALEQTGLSYKLLAQRVDKSDLALDSRPDRQNAGRFPVLFEAGNLRVLRADANRLAAEGVPIEVMPIRNDLLTIEYVSPKEPPLPSQALLDELDSLISEISQDSLESYLDRLQAFTHRLAGTDSNYAARDWIESKFASMGYDSILIDPFIGSQLWDRVPVDCYNVIAVKPGTVYPDHQILIGGHFDAVPDCPGADDNATGTATVLEIARVLKDVDLPMTFVFVGFDSEESWMWGSYHYRDEAVARGDNIVLMINPDMIGHHTNDAEANLYYGAEDVYAQLWDQLAQPLVGITGFLSGSTASDHLPFQEAGIPVIFVQERIFSTHYHLPSDSTTYLNFEYMTRMVKATLATVYNVGTVPPPVELLAVDEPGDGQSKLVRWQRLLEPTIDHYRISWYGVDPFEPLQQVTVPAADSIYLVEGLTEGTEYAFYVQAFDGDGLTAYAWSEIYAAPYIEPRPPEGLSAMPVYHGIRLNWRPNNTELDFDHYAIVRDAVLIDVTGDTTYVDDDPTLGSDFHEYLVAAVDTDNNQSDTVGLVPAVSRGATLEANRILALNRTSNRGGTWVNEVETGVFMREALTGFQYDYYSDTAAYNQPDKSINLVQMLDCGTMVIGDETGRGDDLSMSPSLGGILDSIAYYLSIGGSVVVFGRFGEFGEGDTIRYAEAPTHDDSFASVFHTGFRYRVPTTIELSTSLVSDYIGAHTQAGGYPDLVWDSVRTAAHTSPFLAPYGIPFASFVGLNAPEAEVIYTYDSRDDNPASEGKPVGWRYLGPDYKYVFLDVPLSFCERDAAIAALQRAVTEVSGLPTAVNDETDPLPRTLTLYQNYPNPFNPETRIEYTLPRAADVKLAIFNILGRKVRTLVDEHQAAGAYAVDWNGADGSGNRAASGMYLYRLESDGVVATRKMVLLK